MRQRKLMVIFMVAAIFLMVAGATAAKDNTAEINRLAEAGLKLADQWNLVVSDYEQEVIQAHDFFMKRVPYPLIMRCAAENVDLPDNILVGQTAVSSLEFCSDIRVVGIAAAKAAEAGCYFSRYYDRPSRTFFHLIICAAELGMDRREKADWTKYLRLEIKQIKQALRSLEMEVSAAQHFRQLLEHKYPAVPARIAVD